MSWEILSRKTQKAWRLISAEHFLNVSEFLCRGAGPGCNTREISDRLVILKRELESLEEKERILDEHKSWIQQSLKIVSEDFDNEKLAFVTYEDLCQCFRDDTLLAIQAPAGTELEVPIPEKVRHSWQFFAEVIVI